MANDDAVLMGATSYAPMVDFQLPQAPELPQQPEQSEQGFWNQFHGSIGQTVFQDNPRLSGRAIEGLGRVSGSESMKGFGEGIVAEFDATPEHEKFIPRVSTYEDVEGFGSLMDYMGSTIGQGLGSMAMTVGGAAVGAGGGAVLGSVVPGAGTVVGAVSGGATGGAVAGSFLLNYGDMYDYLVEQEGMDEDQAAHFALIPGSIMAALDATGVGKLAAAPFRKGLSDKLRIRMVQLAAEGVAVEGITEAAQGIIQEVAGEISEQLGYATEDIEFADRAKSVFNQFLAGGLTGGAVGGASSVVKRPAEAPDTEKDTPPAPQTAEEADSPVEVMVEEAAEPEAAPEVEAAPETEAEQAAEEEVQKEEDPEEPKSDLTLTSDGKSFSKVFKFLLNPPPGVGYEKTVLDEQGNPVQEQEVDENGEPVFLESGKPKMGPAQKQMVYKVSDLYAEDEKGKASGALSKYPKGELELLGVHEFLIQKSHDIQSAAEAMAQEEARLRSELNAGKNDIIQAAYSTLRHVNPPDRPRINGPKAIEILESYIEEQPSYSSPEERDQFRSLISGYESLLGRTGREIGDLDVSQFATTFDKYAEAEVTQDEINQYIADNQWRLDFGDVRRQTSEAYEAFVASPELQQLESEVTGLIVEVGELEDDSRRGMTWEEYERVMEERGTPEAIDEAIGEAEVSKSVWGEIDVLNQQNHYHDPALLDLVISSPTFSPFHRRQHRAILAEALEVQSGYNLAYYADSTLTVPPNNAFGKVHGFVIGVQDRLGQSERLRIEALSGGPSHHLRDHIDLDETLKEAASLRKKIKSDLVALGGKDRQVQLIQEINDWVSSKTPEEYIGQDAPLRRQLPRVYASTKFQNLIDELDIKKWELADPKTVIGLLEDWGKTESIYSEQMPERQQKLFIKEFEAQKKKYEEAYLINTHVVAGEGVLSRIIDYVSDLKKFEEVENTELVRNLRSKQHELSVKSSKEKNLRDSEMADSKASGGLGYTLSSESPQITTANLTASRPVNMRQILIIDPSPEMRDYKAELAHGDSSASNVLRDLLREVYRAVHWDAKEERGTGVHIRAHDMWIERAGELIKILVIDEIQNDHAQGNRKYGSRISALRSLLLKSRLEANEARRQEIVDLSISAENPNAVSGSLALIPEREFHHRTTLSSHGSTKVNEQLVDPALKDEYVALVKEAGKLHGQINIGDPASGSGRINPQAVFQNTEEWSQLAMRKAFQIAIEEEYGGIAVIGGMSAGPITNMRTVEGNLSKLKRQFANLDDDKFFPLDDLLWKQQDPIWNETKWHGKIADMPLNIDKLNQTIGLNDFIQTGRLRGEQVPGFEGQGRPRPVFDDRNFPINAFYQDPKTGKFEKVVTVPSEDPAGQTSLIFNVTTESGETKSVSAENLSYQGDYAGVFRKPGTMPFLIPESDVSAGLYGKTIKFFLSTRDEYIGSSAQKHYDENVADQGKIIAGVEGTPAMGENVLRIADGTPVYTIDEANPDFSTSLLRDASGMKGRDAYVKAPPKLWVFDDKMTRRLSGPQPIISPELRDIKGGWDRSLKDLLNEEKEKAEDKRKEGVVYFEDMTHHEHASIVKRIKDSTESLPNLEYPFMASLGHSGGKAVEVVGHLKGVTLSVKMSGTAKPSKMPAMNLFVGNDRLVEKNVEYLVDPKKAQRIRRGHAESIRKAMEEGHDIPQESLDSNPEFGGWGLEEDYELEEDVEADVEPEPLWYSVLERSVASLPDEPIPVDDVEGTLQRAARRLVGEDVDLAVVPKQRREGVVYIDDLTEPQLDEIAKQIEKQKENLPNLEYPFSATIGSPGGDKTKNIEVVRHVGKDKLEVKLENGRTIEVPPDSVYVGSAPLVAKKPERLVDPSFERKGVAGAEVSTSEIAALKLDDFIEGAKASGQKSISKEDLAKHVEENQMQMGEVIFGDPEVERSPEVAEAKANFEDAWTAALPTILSIGNRHIDGGFTTAQIHRMKHRPDEMVYATVVHDLSEALNAATRVYSSFRILSAAEASASPLVHLTEAAEPLASIDRSEFYSVSNFSVGMNLTRTFNPEAIVEAIEKVRTIYRFLYERMNRPDVVQVRKEDVDLMLKATANSGQERGTSLTENFKGHVKYLRDRDRWSDSLPDQKQAQEIIERNTAYERIEKFLGKVGRPPPGAPAYADPDSRLFDGGNLIKDLISAPRWVDYMGKHGKLKAVEGDSARRETEFEEWTLPGGENYYEIVITADSPSLLGEPYTEGHHDVDNTVVHIRLKVRIDSKGRRILFVEEIQSDWHQEGRKRGYSKEENSALREGWHGELYNIRKKRKKLSKQEVDLIMLERRQALEKFRETGVEPESGSKLFIGRGFSRSDEAQQLRIEQKALREKRIKIEEKIEYAAEEGPVVEGVFKKTQEWVGLAVRRILREAAEGGYDGVAFTTGDSVYGLMRGDLEGQRKFYDEILPSIVKKESKSEVGKTIIKIPGELEVDHPLNKGFNFVEMTPKVKARSMKSRKLFEVLIAASSVPAAAALMGEDEEEPERAEQ